MEILTPMYKEIRSYVMSDGWKSTINRPILKVITAADGHANVRRAFDASGLDNNSEPIDGLDESIRKKVHTLFMSWWNTFHTPVHSGCFLMDKGFCRMEHDSVAKLELIQVIKDFCTVETADGTKVGRDGKVVKSEYVS